MRVRTADDRPARAVRGLRSARHVAGAATRGARGSSTEGDRGLESGPCRGTAAGAGLVDDLEVPVKKLGRPKGAKDGRGVSKPRAVLVCFEDHRADGRVWAVRVNTGKRARWRFAKELSILCPLVTQYRGPHAPQPRAFLVGYGVVTRLGDTLVISA